MRFNQNDIERQNKPVKTDDRAVNLQSFADFVIII